VLALGQNVVGAIPGGATSAESGTSAATPIVAGVAALLMSKLLKTGRRPDGHVVKQAILRGAVGCEARPVTDCRRLLVGRLNVPGAVTQLQE
jgi:subtilisin family serine protease